MNNTLNPRIQLKCIHTYVLYDALCFALYTQIKNIDGIEASQTGREGKETKEIKERKRLPL